VNKIKTMRDPIVCLAAGIFVFTGCFSGRSGSPISGKVSADPTCTGTEITSGKNGNYDIKPILSKPFSQPGNVFTALLTIGPDTTPTELLHEADNAASGGLTLEHSVGFNTVILRGPQPSVDMVMQDEESDDPLGGNPTTIGGYTIYIYCPIENLGQELKQYQEQKHA
jgi:hypothetical protein